MADNYMYSLAGIGTKVELGKGGPVYKDSGGAVENRNNADAAYAIERGAPANDQVTLGQIAGLVTLTPEQFGAVGDSRYVADAAITIADNTLTSATAQFTPAMVGYTVSVDRALDGNAALVTTIASFTSSTSVELAAAAGATVTGQAAIVYGTDDTAAWQAALNASALAPQTPVVANGTYHVTGLTVPELVTVLGGTLLNLANTPILLSAGNRVTLHRMHLVGDCDPWQFASGPIVSSQDAIYINGHYGWRIIDCFLERCTNAGLRVINTPNVPTIFISYQGNEMVGGMIGNCSYDWLVEAGGEYCKLDGVTMYSGYYGAYIIGGNAFMNGGAITGAARAVALEASVNGQHGTFTGVSINHSGGYCLLVLAGVANSHLFTGCTFFGGVMSVAGAGIQITGGIYDPSELWLFAGCAGLRFNGIQVFNPGGRPIIDSSAGAATVWFVDAQERDGTAYSPLMPIMQPASGQVTAGGLYAGTTKGLAAAGAIAHVPASGIYVVTTNRPLPAGAHIVVNTALGFRGNAVPTAAAVFTVEITTLAGVLADAAFTFDVKNAA